MLTYLLGVPFCEAFGEAEWAGLMRTKSDRSACEERRRENF